jgi:hypothetical protein
MSSPWSEDYYTPVAEMDTNYILKSTITDESRQQKGDSRTCLLCGFSYFFRPIRVRYHLGLGNVSKKVQKYKPSPEHIERHAEVVNEMKRRDEDEKIQAREMAHRSLESGQTDDDIDVEKFGKRPRSSNDEITRPFQKVRKREEVDLQWARAVVSAGFPMSFFDNPEVHKTDG